MPQSFKVCAIMCVLACTVPAFADETSAAKMLQMAPDECFALAVTPGWDEVGPAFNATIMGKMINDPQTRTFIESVKNQLLAKAEQKDPNARQAFDLAMELISVLYSRPAIFGAATKTGDKPAYGFFIVDANASRVSGLVDKIEARCKKCDIKDVNVAGYKLRGIIKRARCDAPPESEGVPVYWGFAERYFVFTINDANGLAFKYLASSKPFARGYLNGIYAPGDMLSVYLNTERMWALFKQMSEKCGETEKYEAATRVINELGLCGIDKIISRIGTAGPNLTANSLISIKPTSARSGLLACLKPADLSMFNIVDANAAIAATWNSDIAGVYDTVMRAISAADANAYESAKQAIARTQTKIKFDIRNDLLGSLSGPATFYTMPAGATVENPAPGLILMAKLSDSAKFEKAMNSLGDYLASVSKSMMQIQNTAETGPNGQTLHHWTIAPLAMMQVAPCWTAADNMFVFGTNPALCKSAAIAAAAKKPLPGAFSLTPTYKKAAAKFPKDVLGVKYINSRVQFMQTMSQIQQFWPLITMNLTREGIVLPATLPDLSGYARQMGPEWEYSWFDEKGYNEHYTGPGLNLGVGGVAGGAVGLAVVMPAISKARQTAKRVVSMSNLKAIGNAIRVYAADNNDTYPPNLDVLIKTADLTPKTLDSPKKPANFHARSYLYVAGQNMMSPPDNVLVYENPAFDPQGTNVLFNDGHVQFMKKQDFQQALARTYKNLGKPMPQDANSGSQKPHSQ